MRPRGTGTIEQMRDGTYRGRLPTKVRDRLDPCATYEEAERLLDAALSRIDDGSAVRPGGETLHSWGETWLERRELAGAVEDIGSDKSRWRQHVASAYFFEWPLKTIASSDVREWLADMMQKKAAKGRGHSEAPNRKLARTTIQNTLNLLRVAFEAAVDAGLIADNPARAVRLHRAPGVTHEPWTYLVPEEQNALLHCQKIPIEGRLLIAFAMGTGLREGEVWNLELRDAHADHVVVRYGKRGGSTKGKRIQRVPLFGIAREAIAQWRPKLAKRPNPHGLVWPLPSGARRQDGKAPEEWAAWLAAARIEPSKRHDARPVRWHDLRHTCGSSLVAGWWGRAWSLIEVRDLLRHRSVTTTERYSHLAASVLDAAARATDASTERPQRKRRPAKKLVISLAPPRRLERPTNGLGSHSDPVDLPELGGDLGEIVDARAALRAGLETLAAGQGAAKLIEAAVAASGVLEGLLPIDQLEQELA